VSGYIEQACAEGARLGRACAAVGLSERTLQRWRRDGVISGDGRTRAYRAEDAVRSPANRVSEQEQQAVLAAANAPRFASLSPHQIVLHIPTRRDHPFRSNVTAGSGGT